MLHREETAQAKAERTCVSERLQLALWVRRAASDARLRRAVSPADGWHHGTCVSFRVTGSLKTEAQTLDLALVADRG